MEKKVKSIILKIDFTCRDYEIIDFVAHNDKVVGVHEFKTLKV